MFRCTVDGAPGDIIQWVVNGKRVNDSVVTSSNDRKHSNLTLTKLYCLRRWKCSIECRVKRAKGAGYWYSTAELVIQRKLTINVWPLSSLGF